MSDVTTLKSLCEELKVDPKIARKRLRSAIGQPKDFPALAKSHKPSGSWRWVSGSDGEKEARSVIVASPQVAEG